MSFCCYCVQEVIGYDLVYWDSVCGRGMEFFSGAH